MENNLAVLIDFENIAAGTEKEGLGRFDVDALMMRVKDKGRILVARSYADWGRFSRFKQSLLTANVTMMELTSHGMQDKNRADIAMVVDCLELAFTRDYIHTFVVVSGDSDFTPLVLKMRELNKRVIGIGTRKSTSRLLIQACDEFVFYDSVVQQSKPKRVPRKEAGERKEMAQAFDLLEQALEGLQRESPDQPLASVVKSAVLRKGPDFNESDLGFGSFARFLEAAQDAGVVRLSRDQKSGGYRVSPADDDGEKPSEETDEVLRPWSDPYLPAGTDTWLDTLARSQLTMVGAPVRMAVLEALVDVVAERSKKRRKTTLQFVREDVKRKLRRTHPDLPVPLLKSTLDALMHAGELIHRDGTAIRSGTAPFTLAKSAEGLNESVVRLYLAHLRAQGCDLTDTRKLADLMYGDPDRNREIEETLAYLATDGGTDDLDLDLDDLLVSHDSGTDELAFDDVLEASDGEDAPAEPAAESDDDEPKKRRSRRGGRRGRDRDPDLDDLLEVQADPVSEPDAEAAADEPAPKKRTRRRAPRKASAEDGDSAEVNDLDALLEPQP